MLYLIRKYFDKKGDKKREAYNIRREKLLKDTRLKGKGIVFYVEKKII